MMQRGMLILGGLLVCLSGFAAPKTIEVGKPATEQLFWVGKNHPLGGIVLVDGEQDGAGLRLSKRLASQLAKKGWSVVLVDHGDKIPDALSALRQKGMHRLLVAHYGGQLATTLAYFSKPQAKRVNGMILFSAYDKEQADTVQNMLKTADFPMYDVSGQFEYFRINMQVKARQKALHKTPHYASLLFPGARHGYNYSLNGISAYMNAWMRRLPVTESAGNLPQSPF